VKVGPINWVFGVEFPIFGNVEIYRIDHRSKRHYCIKKLVIFVGNMKHVIFDFIDRFGKVFCYFSESFFIVSINLILENCLDFGSFVRNVINTTIFYYKILKWVYW